MEKLINLLVVAADRKIRCRFGLCRRSGSDKDPEGFVFVEKVNTLSQPVYPPLSPLLFSLQLNDDLLNHDGQLSTKVH